MSSMLSCNARSLLISATKRQRQQVASVVLGRTAGWQQVPRGITAAAGAAGGGTGGSFGDGGRLRLCKDNWSTKGCLAGDAVVGRRLLHNAAATDKEPEEVGQVLDSIINNSVLPAVLLFVCTVSPTEGPMR